MQLVYLSPVPWNSFAQRPHKFVEWFHARTGGRVLWIEPYPTRFPRLDDIKRMSAAPDHLESTAPPDWLHIVKPRGLPIEPMPGSGKINMHFWQSIFQSVEAFAHQQPTSLVIGKPSILALKLLKRLPRSPSLYDAMDDFPAFYEGLSRLAFARRERHIAHNVSAIWTSSTELKKRWNQQFDKVSLVLNGLDPSALPPCSALVRSPSTSRVFGYVGTIASWFDWEWVVALAQHCPQDEFRFIGPIFQEPAMPLPTNIRLLPACDHEAALRAMMEFDVGLIPFRRNKLTVSVDPIKYYEYRALGIPVLSTEFGEMRYRTDEPGVFISRNTNDAVDLATQASRMDRDLEQARAFAARNTWEQRFDQASSFLQLQHA
ncbi:glycosyl transferase [Diaphorobacter sp.]|uniref:glycosyl transferase n=1 Tax=Diaphorobacter sp. TaxID=1934310 RepID=UPI0028AD0C01|nr:glycosyl transferase [Diaphorobacter sp.]